MQFILFITPQSAIRALNVGRVRIGEKEEIIAKTKQDKVFSVQCIFSEEEVAMIGSNDCYAKVRIVVK